MSAIKHCYGGSCHELGGCSCICDGCEGSKALGYRAGEAPPPADAAAGWAKKEEYEFTVDWFSQNIPTWEKLFEAFAPKRILEIGAYEGRATVWMGEHGVTKFHVIDTWKGGQEHSSVNMSLVRDRFIRNMNVLRLRCGPHDLFDYCDKSDVILRSEYLPVQSALFDLIYIDGSHEAKDVLTDAVLCYPLLKDKGLMIFDDYLWKVGREGQAFNPLDAPGMAIDAFAQIFAREMGEIRGMPLYQRYFVKVA